MKRTVLTLAAFLLSAIPCLSQVAVISGQVNYNGFPVASAPIRVCSVTSTGTPCTPTTPIYSNYDLAPGHQIPNPTAADQYGNFTIFVPALAAPNLYIVQITPSLGITWSYVYNGAFLSASGGTITGNLTVTGNLIVDGTTTSGVFNATVSPYYEVNGTQIACANLSDCANLAKINAANVFTGSPQTAPIFNATTQFNVAGSQIASANLADGSNLAKLNASNTFTGSTQTVVNLTASGSVQAGSLKDTGAASGGGENCLQIDASGNITNTGSACVTAPTLYYQTLDANGTAQTQRAAANFSQRFTLTDSASPARTNIDANAPGTGNLIATYASSPSTSTAIASFDGNGNLVPSTLSSNSCASFSSTASSGCMVTLDGKWLQWAATASQSAGFRGSVSVSWPVAFPNHLFQVQPTITLTSANTTTNWEGQAAYVQPVGASVSGCSVVTGLSGACVRFDSRADATPDTGVYAVVFAWGN